MYIFLFYTAIYSHEVNHFLHKLLTKVSGRDANIVFGDKLHRTEIFFGAGRHNWIEIGNVSFVEQAFKIESLGYPFSPAITN